MLPRNGYILICDAPLERVESLKEELSGNRCVVFSQEKFLVDDAKMVISEAYISENKIKYILIAAKEFTVIAQNTLLKILEEPPKNIVFILLSSSKSALLPTIRSRLPIRRENHAQDLPHVDLNLRRLDLAQVFSFLQEHKNIQKNDLRLLVEAIFHTALQQGVHLSTKQLENFDMAFRLLELNTRGSHILSLLLMGFLHEH
jgi:DNA polymerase-3 subunit delta'